MFNSDFRLKPLQVKKLHPNAILPTRATMYDAGYDLYALEDGEINPNEKEIIGTGIAVRIPQLEYPFKVYGSIRSRSGLSAKNNLEVGAGVVDLGYSREIKVILYNHNKSEIEKKEEYNSQGDFSHMGEYETGEIFYYKAGDRVAQLVLEVHISPEVEEVEEVEELSELESNDRVGGFGSTGL